MENKNVELLAPAGNFEAMVAAVNNGADAVYLGGKAFGARHYASNFSDEELIKATQFIQRHNRKIYLTVNTLLSDRELESAAHYLKFLYEIGVDAVIVQDLGLIKILRDLLPNFEIHASTQMTINNAEGVNFLERHGVSRVVLAREVSLENIKLIKERSNLELETFVHGALCVCYSGQCLMSSMIGGRSGNRGKCAQPCRLKYRLLDLTGEEFDHGNVGEHLLSPKDLNTIDFLPKIIEAGITSLKIEGRMKRPEYVATVTRIYRTAIDRYCSDPKAYNIKEQEHKELAQIFNRDFTSGYYLKHQGSDLMSFKRPNNRGLFIGRISKIHRKKKAVAIKLVEDISVGDGIEIWVTHGGRKGLTIEKIWVNGQAVEEAKADQEAVIEVAEKVSVGDRVFKTYDAKLMKIAQESLKYEEEELKAPIKMEVLAQVGSPLHLKVSDEAGNMVEAKTSFIAEKAKNRPLTFDVLRSQLERLGNTPYYLADLACQIEGDVMVPLSELNKVRREAIEKLESIREAKQNQVDARRIEAYFSPKGFKVNSKNQLPFLSIYVSNVEAALKAIEAGVRRVYLASDHFRSFKRTKNSLTILLDEAKKSGVQIVIALPRLWQENGKAIMEKLINTYEEEEIDGFLVGNLGSLELLNTISTKKVYLDYSLNVFNSLSFSFLESHKNLVSITLSPELTFDQISELSILSGTERECIVHGSLPLMISEYCAVGALVGGKTAKRACTKPCINRNFGLKDRLNFIFPLEMDERCRMYVYNSKDLCLLEDLGRFHEYGIDSLRIEARRYTPEEIDLVVTSYNKGLEVLTNKKDKKLLTDLKMRLEEWRKDTFTKGHYYRGVL